MFCKTCNKHVPLPHPHTNLSGDWRTLCHECIGKLNAIPFTLDEQQAKGVCGYFEAEKEQALRLEIKKVAGEAIQRLVIDAFTDDVSLMSASDIAELISWEVMRVIEYKNVQLKDPTKEEI